MSFFGLNLNATRTEKLQHVPETLAGKVGKAVSEQTAKEDQEERGVGVRKSGVSGAGKNSGLSRWSLTGLNPTQCAPAGNPRNLLASTVG